MDILKDIFKNLLTNKAFFTLYLPLFVIYLLNSWIEVLLFFPFAFFFYFFAVRTDVKIKRDKWKFDIDMNLKL